MSKVNGFSERLLKIELALYETSESIGGETGVKLMDRIAALPELDKQVVIKAFSEALDRMFGKSENLEKISKGLGDAIYNEVLTDYLSTTSEPKLRVLNGGRCYSPEA